MNHADFPKYDLYYYHNTTIQKSLFSFINENQICVPQSKPIIEKYNFVCTFKSMDNYGKGGGMELPRISYLLG